MAQIPVNVALAKAALMRGLRVGIIFKHEDTTAEYHFIRDSRNGPGELKSIMCVMYTSTCSDPLRLCGVRHPLNTFTKLIESPITQANYITQYQRVEILLYPGDWYPCFETNKSSRINDVKKVIPELKKLAEKISEEDKKALEEEHTRKAEDLKRIEAEFRRMEEASRRRIESAREADILLSSFLH